MGFFDLYTYISNFVSISDMCISLTLETAFLPLLRMTHHLVGGVAGDDHPPCDHPSMIIWPYG